MAKKTILVTGAGGSASTNFIRSLRLAPEKFYIIGVDCNKFYLKRSEADRNYLVPKAISPNYIAALNKIINMDNVEFIHAQNDAEVSKLSEERESLAAKTFLPPDNVVKICRDKWLSRVEWERAGIEHPKTYLVKTASDIEKIFANITGSVWIRDTVGAGGKGSLKTSDINDAFNWINYNNGWGYYTIAEYLSDRSSTFTTIWKDGVLIAGQGRKRLYWELGPAFISGVSGATGAGAIDNSKIVRDMAMKAILAIDNKPHGIYSVDLTYGRDGIPYPTEINIGRFFTTHYFFAKAGFNLAYIYTKCAYNEEVPIGKVNILKEGLVWIRGMDFEPILTTMDDINAC